MRGGGGNRPAGRWLCSAPLQPALAPRHHVQKRAQRASVRTSPQTAQLVMHSKEPRERDVSRAIRPPRPQKLGCQWLFPKCFPPLCWHCPVSPVTPCTWGKPPHTPRGTRHTRVAPVSAPNGGEHPPTRRRSRSEGRVVCSTDPAPGSATAAHGAGGPGCAPAWRCLQPALLSHPTPAGLPALTAPNLYVSTCTEHPRYRRGTGRRARERHCEAMLAVKVARSPPRRGALPEAGLSARPRLLSSATQSPAATASICGAPPAASPGDGGGRAAGRQQRRLGGLQAIGCTR